MVERPLSDDELRDLARQRHTLHADQKSHRPLGDDYEAIGLAGERALSEYLGVPVDTTTRREGSGGINFEVEGHTINVYCANIPKHLLVEAKPRATRADLYVLAQYLPKSGAAVLMGFATRAEVLAAPVRDYGRMGVTSHGIPAEALHPYFRLREWLAGERPGDDSVGRAQKEQAASLPLFNRPSKRPGIAERYDDFQRAGAEAFFRIARSKQPPAVRFEHPDGFSVEIVTNTAGRLFVPRDPAPDADLYVAMWCESAEPIASECFVCGWATREDVTGQVPDVHDDCPFPGYAHRIGFLGMRRQSSLWPRLGVNPPPPPRPVRAPIIDHRRRVRR